METNPIATVEITDLVEKIATLNLGYLAVIVTAFLGIITLVGILFYFISLKPFNENVKKLEKDLKKNQEDLEKNTKTSEEEIEKIEKEAKSSISKLEKLFEIKNNDSLERIKDLEKEAKDDIKKTEGEFNTKINDSLERIKDLEKEAKDDIRKTEERLKYNIHSVELKNEFNEHFMWMSSKVTTNVISSLLSCITKSVEYNINIYIGICLSQMIYLLSGGRPSIKITKEPQHLFLFA